MKRREIISHSPYLLDILELTLLSLLGLSACEASVGAGPAPFSIGEDAPMTSDAGTSTASPGKASAGTQSSSSSASAPAAASGKSSGSARAGNSAPAGQPASPCDDAPQRAEAVLSTYCGACHSNPSNAKAGFSTVLDVPALLMSGKVVASEPEMSLIYKRISNGSMPPADVKKRPQDTDKETIEEWIACGADDWANDMTQPAGFVSIDERLRSVLSDLRSVPNPADRARIRYFDLSALSNAGLSADELQVYREALSFLMNSLSRGRSVIAPVAVDAEKLIYRIDLRDYLWDAESWRELEAIYPYAVIYDQNSRLFPYDEVTAEQIRQETDTQVPLIQADWFLSHGARPPLYYSLLDLPATLDGLAQQLGVDIQRNIDTEQVIRSGFANAGPSQNNRVIERHELGGNRGALWLSYDFSDNLDEKNIFAHPLDFQEDGGEMIFNLDNGLQGYYIANAAGTRLDKAPNNVVQDPASRDGAVEAGLSCMTCHQTDGQLPKYDEIRDFQLNAGANALEVEQVLALYPPEAELMAAFDQDQNRYRSARTALGITRLTNTTLHELDDRHLGIIDLNMVAAVIGLPASELRRAIDASPQALPPEIVTLRTMGGGIQRDSFESIVGDLVRGLGLGEQLLVSADGARNRQAQDRETAAESDESANTADGDAAGGAGGEAAAGSTAGTDAAADGGGGASGGAGGSAGSADTTTSSRRR